MMNFCSNCGHTVKVLIPVGDNMPRHVCQSCEMIHYHNPKIITGCIVEYQSKILLCKRAIEPRYGLWTVPAGFMENNETVEQGAARECYEEACAEAINLSLFGIYNLPYISQVYILFHGTMQEPIYASGQESLEVGLYDEKDIPWDSMAFTVVSNALKRYFSMRKNGFFIPIVETLDKKVD